MTLPEWHLEYWDRAPRIKGVDYAGALTQGDVEEMSDWIKNGFPRNNG
jgi:hypothetical protein